MSLTFLDRLGAAAETLARAETEYRAESKRRLDTLAAERTCAYRRFNLLKGMADTILPGMDEAASLRAQLAYACLETGWIDGAEGYAEVCEQLTPVAKDIHDAVCGAPSETLPKEQGPREQGDVAAAFADFEAWHRTRFGTDFLERLQREASFYPTVDF